MFANKPADYKKLFFDMDSFFAKVEQQVRPELRHKPVVVTPYVGDTGCVIASSYEAKAFGIKTGCLIRDAKRLCPQIKILEARPALYMIYHKEMKKIINSITPFNRALSVDEFVLDLSPSERNGYWSKVIGEKIKRLIRQEVGDYLTCSVGVGPSRFLAKMAGELEKPDGFFVAKLNKLSDFYSKMPKLSDLCGIGISTEKRLKFFGLHSPTEFFKSSLVKLENILGYSGKAWYYRLRGYEVDNFSSKTKTIGHSCVLPPELRNYWGAKGVIKKLIYKVGYRMRKNDFGAKGVAVFVAFLDQASISKRMSVPIFSDDFSLNKHIFKILENHDLNKKIIKVGVSVFNLVPFCDNQISIFNDVEKLKNASKVLDKIADDYRPNLLVPASLVGLADMAPDRISFGRQNYDIRN